MNHSKGFTLIELLVVLSIISLLSSIGLAALNTARGKARDSKRASDMKQLQTALILFYDQYGCLPITNNATCIGGYSEPNAGGWDYSSQGGFMQFLVSSGIMSQIPVDPTNNMTGDGTAGQYAYRYYCYPQGHPFVGLHLGYWKENGAYIQKNVAIGNAWSDSTYICR